MTGRIGAPRIGVRRTVASSSGRRPISSSRRPLGVAKQLGSTDHFQAVDPDGLLSARASMTTMDGSAARPSSVRTL